MIRVLQVFGRMDRGGAESMIMNIYRAIDKSSVQFDFVVHTCDECAFDKEIRQLGGKIYHIPRFDGKNFFLYCKEWKKLFSEHTEWKIIHGHMRSTASIYLSIAKKFGYITITHSHSISSGSGFSAHIKNILQYPLRLISDYYFACSKVAGEWLFGKKICKNKRFFILNNAIDLEKYSYDSEIRQLIRKKAKSENNVIVGHIGRFHESKNHDFLIQIFLKIFHKNPDSCLWLIGDGERKAEIEQKVNDYRLSENVKFLGIRSNIAELLQAIDVIVFPSLFEGLPVSIIEAEAAGVPCLVSDNVSSECKITNNVVFKSLNDSAESWATEALELARQPHSNTQTEMKKANYDINDTAKWLEKFYMSIEDTAIRK